MNPDNRCNSMIFRPCPTKEVLPNNVNAQFGRMHVVCELEFGHREDHRNGDTVWPNSTNGILYATGSRGGGKTFGNNKKVLEVLREYNGAMEFACAESLTNFILRACGKEEGICFNANFHTTDCVIIMPWDHVHPAGDVIGKGRNCQEAWQDALNRLMMFGVQGVAY